MKAKTIIAAVLTAICWISLCLDKDFLMYLSGILALTVLGLDDLRFYFRVLTKMMRKSGAGHSIRKEGVVV